MEPLGAFKFVDNKVIILLRDRVCETPEELPSSELFSAVLGEDLEYRNELANISPGS